MKIFSTIFFIFLNLFQGVAMVYYPYAYLGDKKGKSFIKNGGIFYGLTLTILITIMNYHIEFEQLLAALYSIPILIYSIKNLKRSLLIKIFSSVFPLLIVLLGTTIVSNFMSIVLDVNLSDVLFIRDFKIYVINAIGVQLMILLLMTLSLKVLKSFDKNKEEPKWYEWLLIVTVLVISGLICLLINMVALSEISNEGRFFLALTILGVILINVIICSLILSLEKKSAALKEIEILKIEKIFNQQLIDNAISDLENIRKLQHDYKEHNNLLYSLLIEGKNKEVMELIRRNAENIAFSETIIQTKNEVVNAVINSKLTRARSLGINVTCLSVADFIGIDDFDLARLLSNLIDNATDACSAIASDLKQIFLSISFDTYTYNICIKNTIEHSVLKYNPDLKSTKKESIKHGYGTKIIKDIAKKYNGRCDFYEDNGFFCCNLTLTAIYNTA